MRLIDHIDLGILVWRLPDNTLGFRLMDEVLRLGPRYQRKWFASQREHWLGWLGDYETSGAYSRSKPSDLRAQSIYNKIANPPMLFWLAEAAQVEDKLLWDAFRAVTDLKGQSVSSMCGAHRRIIPFETIERSAVRLEEPNEDERSAAVQEMKAAQAKMREFNGRPPAE